MGRSYYFECSRCGYRAKVAGRADRGLQFFVQTIVCSDCRELYDAVTRLKVPDEFPGRSNGLRLNPVGFGPGRTFGSRAVNGPPTFQAALNRLHYTGIKRFKWVHFKLHCPVSATHRVESWNDPGKCPKCAMYLDKNALPYRIWE